VHTACNQRTNREPVTDLHLQEVQEALQRLRDRGLVATVQEVSDRVPKHRHRLATALPADERELALLAVLMLRGPQTPGELRTRTERYLEFADVASVQRVLAHMAARPVPLARDLGRSPGQSQDRWTHTLGVDEERLQPRVRGASGAAHPEPGGGGPRRSAAPAAGSVAPAGSPGPDLHARVAALEARLAKLERLLGVEGAGDAEVGAGG
jgi:uncharacterized protein YceH (UPF0502 family)